MQKISCLPLFACLILTACAQPAQPEHMAVSKTEAKANPRFVHNVAVGNVSGGASTNALWVSNVDDRAFKEALTASLANLGYLATDHAAKYTIDAELMSLDQPTVAVTYEVTSKVNYTVRSIGGKNTYPITAKGIAPFGDAILGTHRLAIANERSIQANIKGFLNELGAVK